MTAYFVEDTDGSECEGVGEGEGEGAAEGPGEGDGGPIGRAAPPLERPRPRHLPDDLLLLALLGAGLADEFAF